MRLDLSFWTFNAHFPVDVDKLSPDLISINNWKAVKIIAQTSVHKLKFHCRRKFCHENMQSLKWNSWSFVFAGWWQGFCIIMNAMKFNFGVAMHFVKFLAMECFRHQINNKSGIVWNLVRTFTDAFSGFLKCFLNFFFFVLSLRFAKNLSECFWS